MKKDIEWLREQIKNEMNGWSGGNPDYFRGAEDAYEDVKDWLNQLDEPEVLSHKWISENVEYAYFDMLDGSGRLSSATAIIKPKKLQTLLVPKQELPVIPRFVAEFLEGKEDYMLHELFDDEWLYSKHDQIAKWLYDNDEKTNRERELSLVLAHIHGYEVEEEQKYYVLDTENIPMLVRTYGDVNRANTHLGIHEKGRNTEHYQLTEQEIKDYDERYWAFAKPVEEVEG